MGSIEAMMQGSAKRYFSEQQTIKVAQGVSGTVVDKGKIDRYIPYLAQSVCLGLQDLGASDLETLSVARKNKILRFQLRTFAGVREGGVHDLHSYSKH